MADDPPADVSTGSCNCGAVRFSVAGPLRGVVYCHCSQCRKQTGHFYAATSAPRSALTIDGSASIKWYAASADAQRGFCNICGSALFWQHNEETNISILAGAFDGAVGLTGERHIFVADKGDYYGIDDGLPQHPAG